MGMTFASRDVLTNFLLTSLIIIVIPLSVVFGTRSYLEDKTEYSELEKTAYTVVPSVVFINIVMGIYIYKAIKDPENYKKDPPFVVRPKR